MSAICLAGLLVFILCLPVQAAAPAWQFDQAHSNFYFSIRHIFSKTNGSFADFSGQFRFDPDNPGQSSFAFTVKTKSIDTKIPKRDNHLRSEDFFHASKYPEMTFESTDVRVDSTGSYLAEGFLRIKDVRRKMTIPFQFLGVKEHPLNKGQLVAGFEAQFTIDRLEYGVGTGKFYKLGVVDNKVTVTVTLEMLREE